MKIIETITAIILFGTMLIIGYQAKIASNEYKAKNKPVVGIDSPVVTFLLPDGDRRIGKPAIWNESKKKFFCAGKEADVQGAIIQVKIKNFGTETAVDFIPNIELCIGNKVIKTVDSELKPNIIMPGQVFISNPTISKEDLYDACSNNEQIKIKYSFKYSDLTKKKELFEYLGELLIFEKNKISIRIMNTSFKDNR